MKKTQKTLKIDNIEWRLPIELTHAFPEDTRFLQYRPTLCIGPLYISPPKILVYSQRPRAYTWINTVCQNRENKRKYRTHLCICPEDTIIFDFLCIRKNKSPRKLNGCQSRENKSPQKLNGCKNRENKSPRKLENGKSAKSAKFNPREN